MRKLLAPANKGTYLCGYYEGKVLHKHVLSKDFDSPWLPSECLTAAIRQGITTVTFNLIDTEAEWVSRIQDWVSYSSFSNGKKYLKPSFFIKQTANKGG